MEHVVNLHIEKLPEGVYLATSDEVPGLVAQGRTITETLEIARDVARKLIEARGGHDAQAPGLVPTAESFDYPLILG
ncbi:MAG: type II toxin-antitoxin system HicB family antitoxin [Lysobacteraceae bacterium]|jgi:predicted RNase H-like HicB family nuclease|nr:MAG: type II toxin-antitoxin system HicB family antitoxin [Xanthomonadaceae bacterium]